jgi:hypothetical protein
VFSAHAAATLLVRPARSRTDVLRCAATLSEDEALPDLRTTALDEILAVGVVVDHELDDFIGPIAVAVLIAIAPTVLLDEAIDRRLDLKQPRSCVAHAPRRRSGGSRADASTCLDPRGPWQELAIWIITNIRVSPMDREMGYQGKADRFSKLHRFDHV